MTTEVPLEQAVCARCGAGIDPADHFRVVAGAGVGEAYLCRTEHIVAWILRGAQWQHERPWDLAAESRHAHGAVELQRRRTGADRSTQFADVEALRVWASSGGAWGEQSAGFD